MHLKYLKQLKKIKRMDGHHCGRYWRRICYPNCPDNVAKYKAVGEILKQKRKRLYWTPCTKHCFDLMLEKNFRNQGCFDKNVDM